jgi:hypothetical protein
MKVEEYVDLFRGCGIRIHTIGNNHFNRQGLVNYSFPNLTKAPLNFKLLKSIQWKYAVCVLLTDLPRKNTYEFILETTDYNIEKFAKKIRNRIRKSIQNCTFGRPTLSDLMTYGLAINQQTLKRQHLKVKTLTDPGLWEKYITPLLSNRDVVILGAYYADRMVGYLVAIELEGKFILTHAFIDRNDSETTDPMNGLLYTLINQIIEKDQRIRISYGIDSIRDLQELNRFKNNMLFDRVPVSRAYLLNPLAIPFIRLILFISIGLIGKKNIKNDLIRKMIRLYQGHRMLFRDQAL